MKIEVLEQKVIAWSNARGLLAGTTPEKQIAKLMEEHGELARAILHQDLRGVQDAIGDMLVVQTNICAKLGLTLQSCMTAAWEEIKDRKGAMKNGTFVKEGDR